MGMLSILWNSAWLRPTDKLSDMYTMLICVNSKHFSNNVNLTYRNRKVYHFLSNTICSVYLTDMWTSGHRSDSLQEHSLSICKQHISESLT